jgi:hypothetical protein
MSKIIKEIPIRYKPTTKKRKPLILSQTNLPDSSTIMDSPTEAQKYVGNKLDAYQDFPFFADEELFWVRRKEHRSLLTDSFFQQGLERGAEAWYQKTIPTKQLSLSEQKLWKNYENSSITGEIRMSRIRGKDLEEAIFRPSSTKKDDQKALTGTLVFTIIGHEDSWANLDGYVDYDGYPILQDRNEGGKLITAESLSTACAKCVFKKGKRRYFIKRNAHNRLINPIGMYDELKLNKTSRANTPMWNFVEVSQRTFIIYLTFLKTKNLARLTNAEREMI